MHTHSRAHAHKYTDAGNWNVQTLTPTQTYNIREASEYTCIHKRTHSENIPASLTREYDDSVMTPNISPLFHTPLVFFSALLPGRSHNPPAL